MNLRATPGQLAALDAWIAEGSGKLAAQKLGINHHSWRRRMQNLRRANGGAANVRLGYLRGLDTRDEAA